MTRLREATGTTGAGRTQRLAPACMINRCELPAIAGDVLCRDHDRRYRKSCSFCGGSMTDISISRGACGNCWRMQWVKEVLRDRG